MIRALALLAACALPAQSITVTNPTPHSWSGWVRVARPAPFYMGWSADQSAMFVQSGNFMDLKVSVSAGSSLTVDPSSWLPWTRPVAQVADFIQMYGGVPEANGKEMEIESLSIDGAGIRMTWAQTIDLVWHFSTTVIWYPDQPWVMVGTSSVQCYDALGQLFHTTPSDMIVKWGSGNHQGVIVPLQTQVNNKQRIVRRAVFSWDQLANSAQQVSILSAKSGPLTVN
jgi:hypothetical protein